MSTAEDNDIRNISTGDNGGQTTPVDGHSEQVDTSTTLTDPGSSGPSLPRPERIQPIVNPRPEDSHSPATPTPIPNASAYVSPITGTDNEKDDPGETTDPSGLKTEPANAEIQTVQVVGQPTGWAAMAEDIRNYDETKVKECRDDIDTLMTFAGLFSAAITAFLVESYQALLPNKADETIQVLRFIAQQNLIANGQNSQLDLGLLPASSPSTIDNSSAVVVVNILWFASLVTSLIAASFGMLVKQWLREYLAVNNPSAQARLRVRQYREPSLTTWKVYEIAAALPFLLQLSLALFFTGLCVFTASVHTNVGRTTTALICAWALCFLVATILPAFFPRCPYKTAFLSRLLRLAHLALPRRLQSIDHRDEEKLVRDSSFDLKILADVDALQADDDILGTTILQSIGQFQLPSMQDLAGFLERVLNHRLPFEGKTIGGDLAWPLNSELSSLTDRGKKAIRDILLKYIPSTYEVHQAVASASYSVGQTPLDRCCAFLMSQDLWKPLPGTWAQLVCDRLNEDTKAVLTALVRQLDARCIEQRKRHIVILDTLRFMRDSLGQKSGSTLRQIKILMEVHTSQSDLRPNLQPGEPQPSWIHSFSPEGVSAIGAFLCNSIKKELERIESIDAHRRKRTVFHPSEELREVETAMRNALLLKNSCRAFTMKEELVSLLAATFATKNQQFAGAIVSVCVEQQNTFFDQILSAVLHDANQLSTPDQLQTAARNYCSLIQSDSFASLRKTMDNCLKLCFIAIFLVPAGFSTLVERTVGLDADAQLLTTCSDIIFKADINPSSSEKLLLRSCQAQLVYRRIVHAELTTSLSSVQNRVTAHEQAQEIKELNLPLRTADVIRKHVRQIADVPRRRTFDDGEVNAQLTTITTGRDRGLPVTQ